MLAVLRRKYREWRFYRDPTRGHFVPLREHEVPKIANLHVLLHPDQQAAFKDEVAAFLSNRIHWSDVWSSHGRIYFLDEVDAVQFKLSFL